MADQPAQPVAGQNPDVSWALEDLRGRLPALQRRRDYREGRHRSVIAPGNTLSPLVASLLEDLADNMMDDAIQEPVSRLEVTNWTEPADNDLGDDLDDTPTPSARGQKAQDKWEQNRGPARLPSLLGDMFGAGDAYAIVEKPRDGGPSWFAIQDPTQMAVRYRTDRPDTVEVAAKVWREGKGWRLNLYYSPQGERATDGFRPGRLERYATKGAAADGGIPQARAFAPVLTLDDTTGEPDTGDRLEWTRNPVFHFPCDTIGRYGRSILTPLIPLQDLLNKAVADLVTAMEDVALPQRYASGIQAKVDPLTGEELPLRRRARQMADMLTTASKDAQFGQFDGAPIAPFLEVILGWRLEIARKAYLPLHSVDPGASGTVASGLSLLVQEGRQVKRVKAVHRDAGWVLREMMAELLTLDGTVTAPEDLDLEWANPTTRDEQAQWELLTLKADLGVPKRQVLMEGGYDQGEVDAWLEEADAALGGRVSMAGPGIASVTVPGVPGGMPVSVQPAGAATPGVPQ